MARFENYRLSIDSKTTLTSIFPFKGSHWALPYTKTKLKYKADRCWTRSSETFNWKRSSKLRKLSCQKRFFLDKCAEGAMSTVTYLPATPSHQQRELLAGFFDSSCVV